MRNVRPTVSLVLTWLGVLLLGVLIGLVGTFAHRSELPWGLVLAFAAVLSAAVFARSLVGTGGVLALGVGWLVVVQVLALVGPGGDVVVPAHLAGYLWAYGGAVFVVAAAFAPRRWFDDDVEVRPAEPSGASSARSVR